MTDNLSYNYSTFVNKPYNVDDLSGSQGFNDGTTSGTSSQEFSYDQNGNMTEYLNKDIDIQYNLLNLPEKVYFPDSSSRLSFDYDATGNKTRMLVEKNCNPNCTVNERIVYVGNFVYVDDNLEYILNGHGRITKPSGSFIYEYFITDHLGNVRVVFNEEGTSGANPKQYADYYPFGMRFTGTYLNNDNRYLYNSKEWTDDFELEWYNYGARFYDPAVARWHTADPSAESYSSWSPYNYVINNPIRYIDPTGETYLEYMRDTYPEGFWYRGGYNYPDPDVGGGWHSSGGISASGTGSYASSRWVMVTTLYETTRDWYIEGRYVGTTTEYSEETEYKYAPRSINHDQGQTEDLEKTGGDPEKKRGKSPIIKFTGLNHGVPTFESRFMPRGTAVTPGFFIIYAPGISNDPFFSTHELGHAVQYLSLGPINFLSLVAIPSLISVNFNIHSKMPWEMSATRLGYWITSEHRPENPLYSKPNK